MQACRQNRGQKIVDEGVATEKDVDTAMEPRHKQVDIIRRGATEESYHHSQ